MEKSKANKGSNPLLSCPAGRLANSNNSNPSPNINNTITNNNSSNNNNSHNNCNSSKNHNNNNNHNNRSAAEAAASADQGYNAFTSAHQNPWLSDQGQAEKWPTKRAHNICWSIPWWQIFVQTEWRMCKHYLLPTSMHWRPPSPCINRLSNGTLSLLKAWLKPSPWRRQ